MLSNVTRVTPTIVKRFRDALIFLIGGSLAFTQILAPKFNVQPEDFGMWCGLLILLVNFGAKLFGLDDNAAIYQLQTKIDNIQAKK